MNRRNLIRLAALGATVGIIAPRSVLGSSVFDPFAAPAAGGLYYTEDAPGRWSKKVAGHLPTIERSGTTLEVTTGHEMNGFEHYIVKHQVFDDGFNLLSEKMFDPMKDVPVSYHEISAGAGKLYVLSVCNIHDSWLNSVAI